MLLSIFAFITGAVIGRARGGRFNAFKTTQISAAGWLAAGLSIILIVTFIGPSQPIWWMFAAYVAFSVFGLRNLHFAGMVVLLIGMLMNLAPMIANGAVPVSERALVSIGEVNQAGEPLIEGARESTETATSFGIFGDVVPVPIFNVVVSLGDLVIAVALADIAMNILMRARPSARDEDAFTFTEGSDDTAEINLRDTPLSVPDATTSSPKAPTIRRHRPAHASGRTSVLRNMQTIHVPAHAALGSSTPDEPERSSNDDAADRPVAPEVATPPGNDTIIVLNDQTQPEGYVTTSQSMQSNGGAAAVDNRPIIDLTSSPTDAQIREFLRRRSEADDSWLAKQREDAGHAQARRRPARGRRRSNPKVSA